MEEVLWRQGKGANALEASHCEGEWVLVESAGWLCLHEFRTFSCVFEASISSVLLVYVLDLC